MKYIIMADGKGTRWDNYLDIPKHLIKVNNIPLIQDTVNKLHSLGIKDIIVTSHDTRYEFEYAKRYVPLNNVSEIDRFTYELIEDNITFMYGDTYYPIDTLKCIVNTNTDDILYFGNNSIIAIKIKNSNKFKKCIDNLKNNTLIKGNGWNTYQYLFGKDLFSKEITSNFIKVDKYVNINNKEDLKDLVKYD